MRGRGYLRAETAADVGHAQANFVRLDTEKVRELGGVAHGRASRQPDVHFAVEVMHEAAADRFHRVMKHRRRRVGLFENTLRLAKALVDIAPGQAVFQQKISAALFVQNRRARRERFNRVENRRQRLVLDVNLFQRALRRAQIFCNNHGDEIAVEADFVDGDEILIVGNFKMLVRRKLEPGVDAVEVLPIDNTQHTGHFQSFAGIDAQNSRVRIRAQQRCAIRRVRQIRQIFDVLRLAGDFVAQVDPRRAVRILGFRFWIFDSRFHRSPFAVQLPPGKDGDLIDRSKERNLPWPLFAKEGKDSRKEFP